MTLPMPMPPRTAVGWTLALVLSAAAAPLGAQPLSLFERLGGIETLRAVVDETVSRASSDPRSRRSFQGVNLKSLKASVAAHLCQVAGGPCRYEGEPMARAHAGLQLSDGEFDAMDGFLAEALDRHGVRPADRAELQALLGAMRPEVVGQ